MVVSPSGRNAGDLQLGVGLAVAGLAAVVLAAAKLEHDDLLAAPLLDDLGGDLRARDERLTDLRAIPAHEKDLIQRDVRSDFAGQLLHQELLSFGDSVLFSARLDDRVHARSFDETAAGGRSTSFEPFLPRTRAADRRPS